MNHSGSRSGNGEKTPSEHIDERIRELDEAAFRPNVWIRWIVAIRPPSVSRLPGP